MEINELFRSNIRSIREQRGFTQKKLAESAGFAVFSLRDYEAGRRVPSLEVMGQIATALGVNVSQLFESSESAPVLTMPVSKALQRLLLVPDSVYDAIDGLSPKNDVWKVIEGLLKVASEQEREDRGESKDA